MNLADPELPKLGLAHPDPGYCGDLVEVLGGELEIAGQAGSLEDLPRVLGQDVDVLVLPLRFDGESLTQRIPEVLARWPHVAVVVLEESFREPEIRAALAAGARDHAPLDYIPRDLRKVVARVGRRQRERRRVLAVERPRGAGLWSFSCAGGGSGQTTLVLALANELAAAGRKPVERDSLYRPLAARSAGNSLPSA